MRYCICKSCHQVFLSDDVGETITPCPQCHGSDIQQFLVPKDERFIPFVQSELCTPVESESEDVSIDTVSTSTDIQVGGKIQRATSKQRVHNIALVAHDARKLELIDWCKFNVATLINHQLFATGTTAKLLSDICIEYECQRDNNGNPVKPKYLNITALKSGPLGGDQQIGAMIAEGKIDMLIFFCDNLVTQGHQTDISALTRLASLYNIAFATNRTTADMLITSSLFESPYYEPIKPNFESYLNRLNR